ncbi:MAG: GspH/FimT family pseudopilin, partial [Burkholderiaceae bacterium]|nr:GspH/FimT family pseudopilin [Burkholderiaceae bacterium]
MPTGRGFTLIEALVVIAIAAILLAVGVPGFSAFIERNRVAAEVNELITDLALARSEALTRRGRVIVCRSAQPTAADATCAAASGDWTSGWIVFADAMDGGASFQRDPADAREAVIRAHVPASPRVSIQAHPAL